MRVAKFTRHADLSPLKHTGIDAFDRSEVPGMRYDRISHATVRERLGRRH